jgi:hypothetical protein
MIRASVLTRVLFGKGLDPRHLAASIITPLIIAGSVSTIQIHTSLSARNFHVTAAEKQIFATISAPMSTVGAEGQLVDMVSGQFLFDSITNEPIRA